MMLYTVLCLYILQLSLVTSCELEIRQVPDKVLNVNKTQSVQFTCTMDDTCNVTLISVDIDNISLMIRNSPDHNISQNQDLNFQGNLTYFQITVKVNSSAHYYCGAKVLINGKQTKVKANGTLVVVNKVACPTRPTVAGLTRPTVAGLTGLTVNTPLLVLALLSLVCIRVGI